MAAVPAALPGARLPVLDRFDFLETLTPGLRVEVLRGATTIEVPAGCLLYRPGQGGVVFLLRRGLLRGFLCTADGREATLAFVHAGEVAGVVSIFGEPPNAFLQTVTAMSALSLQPERLIQLATDSPTIGVTLARHASHHLRKALHLVAVRTLGTVRERVACDLLERACRRQLATGELELSVSHAELAASVGTSREVVTRAIASLRASGLIRTVRGVVSVCDPDGLAAIYSGFAV